ncbi:MAG: phosphoribosylformylglycinamidine synthase subunit PurQ [Candidatus Omnitrophica bacterium]|nr:phosphoribosylformylglycinamidine synthase subunit PurQ [Candidatus Omnitrophota bacterium]
MVKVIVLRAAGTNCDRETADAFRRQSAEVDVVHINELKSKKKKLSSYHILAIPGGFTYGDDIASGRILGNELKFNLKDDLLKFVNEGKLIIGICNGFQVLVKSGLLPDAETFSQTTTLSLNDSNKFEDRWVHLKKPEATCLPAGRETRNQKSECSSCVKTTEGKAQGAGKCVWTEGIDSIYLPIAHAEGKFIADKEVLKELKNNNQIVFQYDPYNPNGSLENIAGICDKTGRIFGLMPHPERFLTPNHHPSGTRAKGDKTINGNIIFKNAVSYVKCKLLKSGVS